MTDVDVLLIFDNVEDVKNIQDFWVASPHISTLITSRTELVTTLPIQTITEVPFMDKFQGSEFLLKFANQSKASDADKASAQELSELLGGLPLGLTIIAFQIRKSKKSVSRFLEFYRQHEDKILGNHGRPISLEPFYAHNLTTVWKLSFASLNQPTSQFMGVLSLVNPADIPVSLFQLVVAVGHADLPEVCQDEWLYVLHDFVSAFPLTIYPFLVPRG